MSKQQKSPITIARAADLEAVLGTGKFDAAYKEVSGISAAEAKELAGAFSGRTATSKAEAMKLIWARHQSLLNDDAMAAHTKGSTAA